jgi:DNA-binding NarL/FixJ family response regulator
VTVTMHKNPDYHFEAVKAGAAGYVLKDASGERLLGAMRRTLEGESPLNQELAMRLLVRLARERGKVASGGVVRRRSKRTRVGRRRARRPTRPKWREMKRRTPSAKTRRSG